MTRRRDVLWLVPSLAGFSIFYVIPFFESLYYAFVDNAFSKRFAGFGNFAALFKNEQFRTALINTMKFLLLSVPMEMVLSTVLALAAVRLAAKIPFVRSAFFLPVILPSACIVVLWQQYMADSPPFGTLLFIYLWKYSGMNMMVMLSALCGVDESLTDAARMDGAGPWRLAVKVLLPCTAPALFFNLILSLVNSLKIFRESYLLYGSHPDSEVYMLQNYLNNHFEKLNYQNIAAAAIIFAAAVYAAAAVILAAEKRWSEQVW